MEINLRVKGEVAILGLFGSIDVDSANFIEAVSQCLADGYSDILCNFEEVENIDYMGISVIAIAYKEAVNKQARMKFCNIPAHLKNIFALTGMDKTVDIYATEDLALNNFKEDKIIENIKKMPLRRRFKRLPLDIKVELKAIPEKNNTCLKVDLLNLSAVGAYVYGCKNFKLGDEIVLKFKLPPKQEEMELDAKVAWLCDKQIQPHLYPGMGVVFYDITPVKQSKLLEFIDRNLSLMLPEE